jgi:hypothetical protein
VVEITGCTPAFNWIIFTGFDSACLGQTAGHLRKVRRDGNSLVGGEVRRYRPWSRRPPAPPAGASLIELGPALSPGAWPRVCSSAVSTMAAGSTPNWGHRHCGRGPGFPTSSTSSSSRSVAGLGKAAFTATGRAAATSRLPLLDDETLRRGFSRQKAGYARGLARSILMGSLTWPRCIMDAAARTALVSIRDWPWTADIIS